MKEEAFLKQQRLKEGKESPEVFRASIGFDFVFSRDDAGSTKCYCIEINGHESGVGGAEEVSADQIDSHHQILASLRGAYSGQFTERSHRSKRIKEVLSDPDFPMGQELKDELIKKHAEFVNETTMFPRAYQNPPEIEKMADDKREQIQVIPTALRPRTYALGASTRSSRGFWLMKHRNGRGGHQVEVIADAELDSILHEADADPETKRKFDQVILQEYIESVGAELDTQRQEGYFRPASMRFLVDFRYMQDGSVNIDGAYAYQRVGKVFTKVGGTPFSDRVVVSKSRGADAVGASQHEIVLARETALQIIPSIAAYYERSKT